MSTPVVSKIVEYGLGYPEISRKHIMDLFNVGANTASIMKKKVHEEMARRDVRTFSSGNINTQVAYEVWGIDLESAVRDFQKMTRLGISVPG